MCNCREGHTEFIPEEGAEVRDMVDIIAGVDIGRGCCEIVEDVATVAEGLRGRRELSFRREHKSFFEEFCEAAGCGFFVEEGEVCGVEVEDIIVLIHSLNGGS